MIISGQCRYIIYFNTPFQHTLTREYHTCIPSINHHLKHLNQNRFIRQRGPGTVAWMAPEQLIREDEITEKVNKRTEKRAGKGEKPRQR
jgi:hypothetical protein